MPPSPRQRPTASQPAQPGGRPRARGRWWLPRCRQLLVAALALVGLVAGGSLLDLVWPRRDQGDLQAGGPTLQDLAKPPNRAVTLLLIGVDSDRLGDASNKAAPAGPANADTLMLLRVNPSGPVQVLQLPANVAVQVPGQQRPQALASLYRSGGPALVADAVRDLAGLPAGRPDRYLVMSRGSLRALVDGLGLVEVNPSRTMRYRDKSQNLTIDLQTGLQRLRANQVEQLVRWRDPERPLESRLANQEEVARGLQRELALSQPKLDLAELVAKLQGQVETNLSRTETLGLLVAALAPDRQLNFTTLPLEPPSDQASGSDKDPGQLGQLRERVETLPDLFWAEPPSSTP